MGIFDSTSTQSGVPWEPLQAPTLGGVDYAQNLLNRGTYQGPYTAAINPFQTTGINQAIRTQDWLLVSAAPTETPVRCFRGLGQAYQYNQARARWLKTVADEPGAVLCLRTRRRTTLSRWADHGCIERPYRQLTEQTLPGIGQQFNMAGQSAGSRRGIAEGVAQRAMQIALLTSVRRCAVLRMGRDWVTRIRPPGTTTWPSKQAASNLGNFGNQGLGLSRPAVRLWAAGRNGSGQVGTQQQELENQQIQGQMNAFNARGTTCKSHGSFPETRLRRICSCRPAIRDLMGAYARPSVRSSAMSAGI